MINQKHKNNRQNLLMVLEDRLDLSKLEEELDLITIKSAFPVMDKDGTSREIDLLLGEKEIPNIKTSKTLYRIPFLISNSLEETYKRIAINIFKKPGYRRFLVKEKKEEMPILYQINPEQKNQIISARYYTTSIEKLKGIPKEVWTLVNSYIRLY